MELSFNQLKKKDVICLGDGVNLGRICDVVILVPENKVKGYFVTGCKGFRFNRQPLFIPVANIKKIGEDVILTDFSKKPAPPKEECRPQPPKEECRPLCPPPETNCRPTDDPCARPPFGCHPSNCPPRPYPADGRRSFDEYE